jgi:hypothetical protein
VLFDIANPVIRICLDGYFPQIQLAGSLDRAMMTTAFQPMRVQNGRVGVWGSAPILRQFNWRSAGKPGNSREAKRGVSEGNGNIREAAGNPFWGFTLQGSQVRNLHRPPEKVFKINDLRDFEALKK